MAIANCMTSEMEELKNNIWNIKIEYMPGSREGSNRLKVLHLHLELPRD